LAIGGEHDQIIPIQQADLLIQSVRQGCKMISLEASHAPYLNGPAAFDAALLTFLAELSGRKAS
jgi:pimeloyl-ACP methyl ester carboxylesterase